MVSRAAGVGVAAGATSGRATTGDGRAGSSRPARTGATAARQPGSVSVTAATAAARTAPKRVMETRERNAQRTCG